jgi:hypothetical protein
VVVVADEALKSDFLRDCGVMVLMYARDEAALVTSHKRAEADN